MTIVCMSLPDEAAVSIQQRCSLLREVQVRPKSVIPANPLVYNLMCPASPAGNIQEGAADNDMATQKRDIKFTYEDYKHTPEDKRYELLYGDLIMVPAPRIAHQRTSVKIEMPLYTFVIENDLGEVFDAPCDVVLSDTNVVQPDLLFVSKERAHIITEDNIRGAPDLVIEVLSPSTAQRDRTLKRTLYSRYRVSEYWQVDTDAKIVLVLTLSDDGYDVDGVYGEGQTIVSRLLPGFTLETDKIF